MADLEGAIYEVIARYAPYLDTQRHTDEIMALIRPVLDAKDALTSERQHTIEQLAVEVQRLRARDGVIIVRPAGEADHG